MGRDGLQSINLYMLLNSGLKPILQLYLFICTSATIGHWFVDDITGHLKMSASTKLKFTTPSHQLNSH